MYSTLFCLALLTATAASFTIDVPQLTQCQDATISWSEGTPPYYLVVVDPKDPCGEPIFDLGELSSTVIKWDVDLPENKEIKFYVEDSGPDNEAWSKTLTVGASDDASCLSQSVLSYFNMTTPSTASNTASNTSNTSNDAPPSSPSGDIVPVGAANAGNNPSSSGASSTRPGTSTVLVALFAATISLAL